MSFNLIYCTSMDGSYNLSCSNLENLDFPFKTSVFPGGYDRIGEELHGLRWPEWGLEGA